MVGSIYVGLVGWIMLGQGVGITSNSLWRQFALISAIPVVIALILVIYLIPESPRYLISRGNYESAVDFEIFIDDLFLGLDPESNF